ncbi:hypothetical protein ONS95_008923 [Cadophora gregata]|uniref:uncharacterized protein n=1 Tax=Cadophora gregata TaxID=51156 RepID=UPI0026DABAC2|nr:uncharacterized protein ONS95_008923 [Cadophora gregata]KAK0123933.1 hypothetical protein ONS95_008923 [Cadophora gregata]
MPAALVQPSDRAEKRPELPPSSPALFTPPTYTMKEIYDAIPPHCLQPNTLLSLFYVLRDFSYVATLICLATQIPKIPNDNVQFGAWALYSFLQGLVFTGLWEIAHECGHGALSKSKLFNNVTGLIVHSLLFVPFHSWRITHSTHHKNTNNLDKDIAFVPNLKEAHEEAHATHSKLRDYVEDMPITALIHLFFHQLIAFPVYLTINNFALARMAVYPWWTRSHFYLGDDGPNFKFANKKDILISDICIAISAFVMWSLAQYFGSWNIMLLYGFPYLWTNHWIRKSLASKLFHATIELSTNIVQSNNHIPPTHRRINPLLPHQNLDFSARCSLNSRPQLRLDRHPHLPRGHRNTRHASPRLTYSFLPRR